MKIKDIQIDGFGVWSGMTVHSMPDTMTVFYGPNEAGKTTLMNFLRTMFYGFTADRRGRYLPPVYGGKPGGAIRVTGPGGGYEICRRAQLDQGGATGSLSVTGSDGIAQGAHRLTMLLGQVDETIFTNVFAIGLRELQELSTLDDTAAADELYKLSSGLDRVSLVDVIRQLKAGRRHIAGPTPDQGQMQHLMLKREKLKDEIDQLSAHGRRWSELAALKKTQNSELDELKQRIAHWELEAKSYEIAIQAKPTWSKRREVQDRIEALNARTDLPDTAAEKLDELNEKAAEREAQLDELKQKRQSLRDQARGLPVRRGISELANKIEAAVEQTPWIHSLKKNIQRVESSIEQAKQELVEDAKRLGVTEEDQQALLDDRRMHAIPDLSRQAIKTLAEPASEVRMWSTRLKQAKQQVDTEKQELERLQAELEASLDEQGTEDINRALERQGENLSLLRKRIQIQETLDKQLARREQLEEEAIDLQCDEALPVERSLLLGVLFVGGAFLFLWGLGKLLPFFNPTGVMDSQNGLLFVVCGMFMLFFGLMWSNALDRTTVSELDDVEDQIEALRKEIRKTEAERDDLERRLPPYTGSLESRLKEAEQEIHELESLLPIQHNLRAAQERYQGARKRAAQAVDSLRSAKTQWQRMLAQLGLAESLSPKSIRVMADGYDSLLQTRRRLQSLEEELESRQSELGAIVQRIDALSRQAVAVKNASEDQAQRRSADVDDDFYDSADTVDAKRQRAVEDKPNSSARPAPAGIEAADRALNQLAKLNELISSQEQFVHKKRALKEQDQQLAKHAAAIEKSLQKIQRAHSALLAEYRCESEEQLLEQLERKHEYEQLLAQQSEFSDRIQAIVGGVVPLDSVTRLLEGHAGEELEQRWTAIGQRTQQAEQRVEQLQLRQGELSQEMKSLAASSRLAEARLELCCVENQLKACAAHWQTLAVTTGLLDRVCEVYEAERQPETLREASAFLTQLTEGKYVRIWTPLGKNQLRIDNSSGQALPLEVLSRGTREAVFIALRLSLAAAYARRGVTIPLVLDDVLVNFDTVRAESAAKVLRDFAALGHQVVMFTCHEHIMRIFHEIGVQVRVLPRQGEAGEAEIYYPEHIQQHPTPTFAVQVPEIEEPEPEDLEPPVEEVVQHEVLVEETPEEAIPEEPPAPRIATHTAPAPRPKKLGKVVVVEQEPEIDWLWYERNPDAHHSEWVDATESEDEQGPPADLWWTAHRDQAVRLEDRA
ncbi:MAG: AAA family ATPase [bacterium]|nr:AAA family ATPase [bacterium]